MFAARAGLILAEFALLPLLVSAQALTVTEYPTNAAGNTLWHYSGPGRRSLVYRVRGSQSWTDQHYRA